MCNQIPRLNQRFPHLIIGVREKINQYKGDGIPRTQEKNMLGECFPSNVIESEAEGSFLQEGIMSYV